MHCKMKNHISLYYLVFSVSVVMFLYAAYYTVCGVMGLLSEIYCMCVFFSCCASVFFQLPYVLNQFFDS